MDITWKSAFKIGCAVSLIPLIGVLIFLLYYSYERNEDSKKWDRFDKYKDCVDTHENMRTEEAREDCKYLLNDG